MDSDTASILQGGAVAALPSSAGIPFEGNVEPEPSYVQFDSKQLKDADSGDDASDFEDIEEIEEMKELDQLEQSLDDMDARLTEQTEAQQMYEYMSDPIWVTSGINQMLDHAKTRADITRQTCAALTQHRVRDSEGRLIPPGVGYKHCMAWMDRLLAYLSTTNFDDVSTAELNQFHADVIRTIRAFSVLSVLPVSPELLAFQDYVASRAN